MKTYVDGGFVPGELIGARVIAPGAWGGDERLTHDPQGAPTTRVGFVDLETTGLDADADEPTELGLVIAQAHSTSGQCGARLVRGSWLREPKQPIPEHVQALTGIDAQMVAGKRWPIENIVQLLSGCDVLVAHSALMDRVMVERGIGAEIDTPWACSLRDMNWRERQVVGASLAAVALSHGLVQPKAHRALPDVDLTALMLAQPDPESPDGRTLLATLLENAQRPQIVYATITEGYPGEQVVKSFRASPMRWDPEAKYWWGIDDQVDGESEGEHYERVRASAWAVTGDNPRTLLLMRPVQRMERHRWRIERQHWVWRWTQRRGWAGW